MAKPEEMERVKVRRKRLLYQCSHRGMKEMDVILGEFAAASLGGLTVTEINLLETLLEVPDDLLYRWIAGQEQIPAEHNTEIFRRIAAHAVRRGSGTG
jgi:antitoxin CptB